MLNFQDLRAGDFLTELSNYTVLKTSVDSVDLVHGNTGQKVTIGKPYAEVFLIPADQFVKEEKVGREDTYWTQKQIDEAVSKGVPGAEKLTVGDLKAKGIRSIFLDYPLNTACAVCFVKKDKPLSKAAYEKALEEKTQRDLLEITAGNKSLKEVLVESNRNPVLGYVPGEERVMIGYKMSNLSATSDYDFMDVKVPGSTQTGFTHLQKSIDLSTIKWMVADGVKYSVK